MNAIETIDYGEIYNSTILRIFGDEMTYNELKFYAKKKTNTTHLKVEWNTNAETQLVRVWFNNKEVMDKKYSINHSCDMFFRLRILGSEVEEEEDEDVMVSGIVCRTCKYELPPMLMSEHMDKTNIKNKCMCEN